MQDKNPEMAAPIVALLTFFGYSSGVEWKMEARSTVQQKVDIQTCNNLAALPAIHGDEATEDMIACSCNKNRVVY